MGIEPTSKAWEALILPMNYTCKSYYIEEIVSYVNLKSKVKILKIIVNDKIICYTNKKY